jgi:hypothetical protein
VLRRVVVMVVLSAVGFGRPFLGLLTRLSLGLERHETSGVRIMIRQFHEDDDDGIWRE